MSHGCFVCLFMDNYPIEKGRDRAFIMERINEFFPSEEFDGMVPICWEHHLEALEIEKNMRAQNK
jgi:hypothetical protein